MGYMTVKEMETEYPSEWVLIDDPKCAKTLEVESGNVLFHSKDRDELWKKARELKPKHSAVIYTGPSVPKGTVVIL